MTNVLFTGYSFREIYEKRQSTMKIAYNKVMEFFADEAKDDFDQVWAEMIITENQEKLEKNGFIDPKISFSGFFSQGDGACFDASRLDFKKLFYEYIQDGAHTTEDKALYFEIYRILSDCEAFDQDFFEGKIEVLTRLYSHYNTRRAVIDIDKDELNKYLIEKGIILLKEDELTDDAALFTSVVTPVDKRHICSVAFLNHVMSVAHFPEWIEDYRREACQEIYKELCERFVLCTDPDQIENQLFNGDDVRCDTLLFDKYGDFLASTEAYELLPEKINDAEVLDCTDRD